MRNLFFLLFTLAVVPVQAAEPTRSEVAESTIQQALQAGREKDNPGNFGVKFDWFEDTVHIAIHSPKTWIAYNASRTYQADFKTLELSGVTPDMRQNVLRVIIGSRFGAGSIQSVVIRDTGKTRVAHSTMSTCQEPVAIGDYISPCNIYTFDLNELASIRQADKGGKGQFLVTITAFAADSNRQRIEVRKDFEIKAKHLSDLD